MQRYFCEQMSDNKFILNNDDKVMRFQNVIYDPKRDIFCLDTSVSVK